MPSSYWLEAFKTTIFLINRLPTRTLGKSSPWEVLFKKTPNYICLRVIGCVCYPWLLPYTRDKLEFRTVECVFIGYSLNHKGYRWLDPTTGRVCTSRHVVFDENIFPFHNILPQSSPIKTKLHDPLQGYGPLSRWLPFVATLQTQVSSHISPNAVNSTVPADLVIPSSQVSTSSPSSSSNSVNPLPAPIALELVPTTIDHPKIHNSCS